MDPSDLSFFDYRGLLNYRRRHFMLFSQFVDSFILDPDKHLYTAPRLITEAIKHFGVEVVFRSGEPVISFNIFKDLFSNGVNAVYGQEFSIKKLVDVIESLSKESGPNRGIVLLGPPASGKTNIVDLICLALEQYTKEKNVRLYSFFYRFPDRNNPDQVVEVRSSFAHHPILFFTTILQMEDGISKPRQKLFEFINKQLGENKIVIPTYYQNASLDKRNLDILECLIQNPINKGKSLFDILEEYVRVEEIEFNNAQGMGISNVDDMRKLQIRMVPLFEAGDQSFRILTQYLPAKLLYQYEGALISANRGLLHIHDAFGDDCKESDYKPLLMLLGSGKISLESTQASVDSVVLMTTNLEDMKNLENQLTASKLLDRIERIPFNYLLDANSEIEILKRDMSIIQDKYDVDPNLFRIAAYYSVMTRYLPPCMEVLPHSWEKEKMDLYRKITPEQKLFIYASQPNDPVSLIQKLPFWHPFRNDAYKLNVDLFDKEKLYSIVRMKKDATSLENCFVLSREVLQWIDDEFMRTLWNEHALVEGKHGISIRQLQNVMRNAISRSDGRKILVNQFIESLDAMITEGEELHHWLNIEGKFKDRKSPERKLADITLREGEGSYGDFRGLVKVVKGIYHLIIQHEILTATVDRDPVQIEFELRKYVQNTLLLQAVENKAFSHIMIPKFSYVDPISGEKHERPDFKFMEVIENILSQSGRRGDFRKDIAKKYFHFHDTGRIKNKTGESLLFSQNDNFVDCFESEFKSLISHRRSEEEIDSEKLELAFFERQRDPEMYRKTPKEVKEFCETIIRNMTTRFLYSPTIALETILYAIRTNLIDFKNILK